MITGIFRGYFHKGSCFYLFTAAPVNW